MHHPPVSFGKHHKDWLNPDYGNQLLKKQNLLINFIKDNDIQLILSGHDHIYQQNVINNDPKNDIHFIVGGGGGMPLRDVNSKKTMRRIKQYFHNQGFNASMLKQEKVFHYFIVSIGPDTLKITVKKIDSS